MTTIHNPPPGIGSLQQIHTESQKEFDSSKSVSGQKPTTPQQTLTESKKNIPQVNEKVLVGKGLPPIKTAPKLSISLGETTQKGKVAILLGTGDNQRLALMPTKGVPGKNPKTILNLVTEGQTLFNRIMNGDKVPQGKESIAKLMWYLQALGSAKASLSSSGDPKAAPAMFKEGAFSIEDPDHRLETYLQNCNSYKRS
ncbi:hypothetical protein LJC09_05350, partial [Desulfovibrio sp. OttesenSCG-928-F20]|nr:hypothetical protein [Desulfovibrio sp. OttesenSCG-928-F20]